MERGINQKKKRDIKKNGFTLTELITVLVILGILSTTIIIGVSSYIKKSKETTYKSYISSMKTSAENRMIECISGSKDCSDEVPDNGYTRRLTLEELISNGYSEKLKDPEKDGSFCTGYIDITNEGQNAVDLKYNACLSCSKYKEGECNVEEPQEEIGEEITDCSELNLKEEAKNLTKWTNKDRVIYFGCDSSGKNCRYRKTFYAEENSQVRKGQIRLSNGQKCEVDVLIDTTKPTCNIVLGNSNIGVNGWYIEDVEARIDISNNNTVREISNYEYGLSTSSKKDYNSKESLKLQTGVHTVFCYVKDDIGNENSNYKEVKVDQSKPEQTLALGYQIYEEAKNSASKTQDKVTISDLEKYGVVKGIILELNDNHTGKIKINYTSKNNIANGVNAGSWELSFNSEQESIHLLPSSTILTTLEVETSESNIKRVIMIPSESNLYTNKSVVVYSFAKNSDNLQATGIRGYEFNGNKEQRLPYTTIDDNGKVRVVAKSANGAASNVDTIDVTVIDKEKPTCDLYNPVGSKWTNKDVKITISAKDEGASGLESIGEVNSLGESYEQKSSSIVYKKTITKSGRYNFKSRDNAWNYSDLCFTDVKIDKTKPTVTIKVDEAGKITQTKTATIVIKDTGGSGLKNQEICYGWNSSKDSTKCSEHKTISGDTEIKTTLSGVSGTYYLYVKEGIGDTAGNKLEAIVSSGVKLDNTPPTCTIAKSGTLGNNGWYREKDVALLLSAQDEGGSGVSSEYSFTTSLTPTYNSPGSIKTQSDTTGIVWYGYVKDKAGNIGKCDSGVIKVDKDSPKCSVSGGSSTWTNQDVTIKGTCSDTGSGCATAEVHKTYTGNINASESPGMVRDNAGNTTTCGVTTVKIDKTNPTCRIVADGTNGSNGWYREKDVTLQLSSSDTGGSGVSSEYGLTTSATPSYRSTTPTATQTNTSGTIWYGYIKDKAGNIGKCDSGVIKVDKDSPKCSVSGGSSTWTNQDVTITGTCSDTGSGCATAEVHKTYTGNINASESPGMVRDKAGNRTTCETQIVKIDKTSPTCKITTNGTIGKDNWYIGDVKLSMTRSDTGGSGIDNSYNLTTSTTASYSKNSSASILNDTQKDDTTGIKWHGYIKDKAGNVGKCDSSEIKVDKTAPTLPTITFLKWKDNDSKTNPTNETYATLTDGAYTPGDWSNKKVFTIPSNSTDAASGVDHYEYTTTGKTANDTDKKSSYRNVEANGESTIKYRACDKAGNCSGYTPEYSIKVDKDKPKIVADLYSLSKDKNKNYIKGSNIGTKTNEDYKLSAWRNTMLRFETTITSESPIKSIGWRISDSNKKSYEAAEPSMLSKEYVIPNRNVTKANTYDIDMYGDGARLGELEVEDYAGNVRIIKYGGMIDTQKPNIPTSQIRETNASGEILHKSPNSKTDWYNYTIWWGNFKASDNGFSEIDYYEYYSYSSKKTNKLKTSYTYDEESWDGAYMIRAVDKAGNPSDWSDYYHIQVDKIKPTCNGVTKKVTYSSNGVSGSVACSDSNSGCKNSSYSFSALKSSGYVTITDKAGNSKDCRVSVTKTSCGNSNCNNYIPKKCTTAWRCYTSNGGFYEVNDKSKATGCTGAGGVKSVQRCTPGYCASYNSKYTCYY